MLSLASADADVDGDDRGFTSRAVTATGTGFRTKAAPAGDGYQFDGDAAAMVAEDHAIEASVAAASGRSTAIAAPANTSQVLQIAQLIPRVPGQLLPHNPSKAAAWRQSIQELAEEGLSLHRQLAFALQVMFLMVGCAKAAREELSHQWIETLLPLLQRYMGVYGPDGTLRMPPVAPADPHVARMLRRIPVAIVDPAGRPALDAYEALAAEMRGAGKPPPQLMKVHGMQNARVPGEYASDFVVIGEVDAWLPPPGTVGAAIYNGSAGALIDGGAGSGGGGSAGDDGSSKAWAEHQVDATLAQLRPLVDRVLSQATEAAVAAYLSAQDPKDGKGGVTGSPRIRRSSFSSASSRFSTDFRPDDTDDEDGPDDGRSVDAGSTFRDYGDRGTVDGHSARGPGGAAHMGTARSVMSAGIPSFRVGPSGAGGGGSSASVTGLAASQPLRYQPAGKLVRKEPADGLPLAQKLLQDITMVVPPSPTAGSATAAADASASPRASSDDGGTTGTGTASTMSPPAAAPPKRVQVQRTHWDYLSLYRGGRVMLRDAEEAYGPMDVGPLILVRPHTVEVSILARPLAPNAAAAGKD